jgi:hypothetical protein
LLWHAPEHVKRLSFPTRSLSLDPLPEMHKKQLILSRCASSRRPPILHVFVFWEKEDPADSPRVLLFLFSPSNWVVKVLRWFKAFNWVLWVFWKIWKSCVSWDFGLCFFVKFRELFLISIFCVIFYSLWNCLQCGNF